MGSSMWITKRDSGPVLIIEEQIEIYVYTNIHTIILEIDLEAIAGDFKIIKAIIEEGTESLNLNLQDENKGNPKITVDRQNKTVSIPPESHASKILKSTSGKIKIQLAAALKQLEELEEDYKEWLATNFIGEKVDITTNEKSEGKLLEYYAVRSGLHNHIIQEMGERLKESSERKKEAISK